LDPLPVFACETDSEPTTVTVPLENDCDSVNVSNIVVESVVVSVKDCERVTDTLRVSSRVRENRL